ncbi:uncharacterized protein LOC114828549 [Galendromus occidentalis]|uniref:Uncharacterized protein LOC114828549 n=1 Tax=Galendromus occidentalis TaxID=34638 RepID=A0AAJ7SIZ3_9ACAR|nr:uncharacterized protein LOC114828549 [Galendromus occidentalis]
MGNESLNISDRPEDHIFCKNSDCIKKLKEGLAMLTPEDSNGGDFDLSLSPSSSLYNTALEELNFTEIQETPNLCDSVHVGENAELLGLPYQLGVVVPGVTSTFYLPVHPRIRMLDVQCSLNDRPTKCFCEVASLSDRMSVTLTPPSGARGDLLITIDTESGTQIKLAAHCFPPSFALPLILVVPPNQSARVPLHGTFPKSIWLTVQSNLSATKLLNFAPEMKSIPLEIKATPEDKYLNVDVIHEGVLMSSCRAKIDVRCLEVEMHPQKDGETIMIVNNEPFTVLLELEAETEAPLQRLVLRLKPGECHCVKRNYFKRGSKPKQREMKVWLKLKEPLEVLIASSGFSEGRADLLRPKVPRFLFLTSGTTRFTMIEKLSGEPKPWAHMVSIEPCLVLREHVKVEEDPEDPTKFVLQVKKPQRLLFGRIGFFHRSSSCGGTVMPYGCRYVFLSPEMPQVIVFTNDPSSPSSTSERKVGNRHLYHIHKFDPTANHCNLPRFNQYRFCVSPSCV